MSQDRDEVLVYKRRIVTDPLAEVLNELLISDLAKKHIEEFFEEIEGLVPGVERKFKHHFAMRSPIYFLLFLVLTVVIAVFTIVGLQISYQVYGLGFDIFGAIILSRGLLQGPYFIAAQTYVPEDSTRLATQQDALVLNAVDGAWGVLFLLLGFSIQIVALLLGI